MIVTVSPNVALDRVHVVRGFQAGRQSRASMKLLQPGGSGAHASTVIQSLGGKSVALGMLGGQTGALWKAEADRRGLVYDMLPIPSETRESFCLVDLDQGNIVESVEEGPVVEADCLQAVLARLEEYLPRAQLLILSGSLPPGFPSSGLADMLELANRHHVKTVADLHGQHLLQILGHAPWLIKPSLAEFDELIGAATADIHERARACQQLFRDTGVIVALSMSGEGLLVTCAEGQWRLNPPRAHVHLPEGRGRNVIGCGDALVGALAYEYSQTGDLLAAARLGLSAAHCNLGTFGVPEIDAGVTRRLAGAIELEAMWADGSQK